MGLLSKIRKDIEKKYDDVIVDLTEPKEWLHSGNYVLNHILSGEFGKGYPAGRITQVFGVSGAGKSYLISKSIIEAQKNGYDVIVFDSEQALSTDYLAKIGVDTDPNKLLTVQVTTVEQTQKLMVGILDEVRAEQDKKGKDAVKLLLIVDSLGFLNSSKSIKDAENGNDAADMGTKAKALTKMISTTIQKIGLTNTVAIFTNHGAMEVGTMFPELKPKGGQIMEYAPSISLRITKTKLKPSNLEEFSYLYEDGKVPNDLNAIGIVSKIELYKSRFTRPFRKVSLLIPYDYGLPEYAGLFDYLRNNGLIVDGNRRGYYNFKLKPFEKDFTRKAFVKDGYAKEIVDYLLEEEKKGKKFDFIMGREDEKEEDKKNKNEG